MKNYYIEGEKPSLKNYRFEFFTMTRLGSGESAKRHLHPAVEIILIKEGHCTVEINNTQIEAEVGDVFLFRSHVLHSIYTGGGCSYYVLKLEPRAIIDMLTAPTSEYALYFLNERIGDRVHFTGPDAAVLLPYFQKADGLMQAGDELGVLSARAVASSILCIMLKTVIIEKDALPEINVKTDVVRWVYKSIMYIDAHFSEPLTAEVCAKQASVSYSLYARSFKAVIGKTFSEYLKELRLNHAKKLLLSTDKSVSDIALLCGYNHISYFIKEFKAKTSLSPLKFRQKQ